MRKTAVASFHEAGWGAGLGDPARALHGQDAWRQPVECLPEVVRRRVRRRKVKNIFYLFKLSPKINWKMVMMRMKLCFNKFTAS